MSDTEYLITGSLQLKIEQLNQSIHEKVAHIAHIEGELLTYRRNRQALLDRNLELQNQVSALRDDLTAANETICELRELLRGYAGEAVSE